MYFDLDGRDCMIPLIFTIKIVKLMFNCLVNLGGDFAPLF